MKNLKRIVFLIAIIMIVVSTTCLADGIVDTPMTRPPKNSTSNTLIVTNDTDNTVSNTTKKKSKDVEEKDSELKEKFEEHIQEYLVFDILVLVVAVVGISLIIVIALDKRDKKKANK